MNTPLQVTGRGWAGVWFVGLTGLLLAAAAHGQAGITVDLGDARGNAGDTVEFAVSLEPGDTPPATIILVLDYSPDALRPDFEFYEITQTESGGDTVRSAVDPGPAVEDAGKNVDLNESAPGQLRIVITSVNDEVMRAGVLFDLAMTIQEGVTDGAAVSLSGNPDASSATDADGSGDLPVAFEGGEVGVGCVPPAAPTNVNASSARAEGVEVTWSGVSEPGIAYRVYRADAADEADAVPVSGWQSETSYFDVTANAPQPVGAGGCCAPGETEPFTHYYWVQARTDEGCASPFAGPAAGSRGDGKRGGHEAMGSAAPAGSWVVLLLLGACAAWGSAHRRSASRKPH
ncbi:MAG: cohesin domain-containing protein [Candidatus Hydrogenedentota bacterium]